jgi:hypothetical protein
MRKTLSNTKEKLGETEPLIKSENYLKQNKGIIPPKGIQNIENKTNILPWVALKEI